MERELFFFGTTVDAISKMEGKLPAKLSEGFFRDIGRLISATRKAIENDQEKNKWPEAGEFLQMLEECETEAHRSSIKNAVKSMNAKMEKIQFRVSAENMRKKKRIRGKFSRDDLKRDGNVITLGGTKTQDE